MDVLAIIKEEIKRNEAILEGIVRDPGFWQPNADMFYKGRKQQAEELLNKFNILIPKKYCFPCYGYYINILNFKK